MMLFFQDGGHDMILCRKLLPSGECRHCLSLPGICAAVSTSFWSVVHLYLLTRCMCRV